MADALEIMKGADHDSFARIRLHVFGDRPGSEDGYELDCKQRLREILGDCVRFHGTIPAIEVAEALSRTEVLLAPSLEEMFGNQFVEAVAVGSDAIITEQTAMAQNARHLRAGRIIARADAPALAAAIREALASPIMQPERERRRLELADFVGPEAVARSHELLYRGILNEASTSAPMYRLVFQTAGGGLRIPHSQSVRK
jgi:glycosyltransferase involved in cell wall biosynthesis